jgi:glyoxylase I family protein
MKIEHVALNVPDPLAMARWYVDHLGLTVKRRAIEAPYAHFLADDSGTVMVELYGNTQAPVLDFPNVAPLSLHLAFVSHNIDADIKRLTDAGATIASPPTPTPAGDTLAMLRDPWGVSIQLVKRSQALI